MFRAGDGRDGSAGVITAVDDGDIGVVINSNSVETLVDGGGRGAARSTVLVEVSARHLVQFISTIFVTLEVINNAAMCFVGPLGHGDEGR